MERWFGDTEQRRLDNLAEKREKQERVSNDGVVYTISRVILGLSKILGIPEDLSSVYVLRL